MAEPMQTVTLCNADLPFQGFHLRLVVIPIIKWYARLEVSAKLRFGFFYVHPVGEPLSPPFIVFGNRVQLRKIKGNNLYQTFLVHLNGIMVCCMQTFLRSRRH